VILEVLIGVNRRLGRQSYNRDMYCQKDDINVICELLAVKHGDVVLDLFSNSVLDAFIEFLRTVFVFCVLLYDFHNKINKIK